MHKFYSIIFDYDKYAKNKYYGQFKSKTEAKLFKACIENSAVWQVTGIDELDPNLKESIELEGSGEFLPLDKIPLKVYGFYYENGEKKKMTKAKANKCFNSLRESDEYKRPILEELQDWEEESIEALFA